MRLQKHWPPTWISTCKILSQTCGHSGSSWFLKHPMKLEEKKKKFSASVKLSTIQKSCSHNFLLENFPPPPPQKKTRTHTHRNTPQHPQDPGWNRTPKNRTTGEATLEISRHRMDRPWIAFNGAWGLRWYVEPMNAAQHLEVAKKKWWGNSGKSLQHERKTYMYIRLRSANKNVELILLRISYCTDSWLINYVLPHFFSFFLFLFCGFERNRTLLESYMRHQGSGKFRIGV